MEHVTIYYTLSAPYAILFHVAMFFVLNEYRCPRKRAALLTFLLNAPILALTIAAYLMLGSERGGQLAVFFYILPQMAVSFFLSRYRDGRVFSTYFFVAGIFIFIIQISNLIDHYVPWDNHIMMFLVRLIAYPLTLFLMVKYLAKPYRRAIVVLKNGWTLFAYLSGMYTLLLLVVFNFPTTLSRRPHDIPVLVLVFGVMLLTNLYFMETLLRQHDHYLEVELNQYRKQQMEMMRQRIAHTEESEKNISIYRHDLRHILATLSGMLREGSYEDAVSYIEDHIGAIESDPQTRWCRNPALNAMFSAYFAEAKKQGIRVEAEIDLNDIEGGGEAALSLVCANAIENAIHAVSELSAEERIIRVRALQSPKLMFSVSNPYEGSITLDDNGIPVSEEEGHGTGIRSILAYCQKQDAVCDFKITDGWFAVRIVGK